MDGKKLNDIQLIIQKLETRKMKCGDIPIELRENRDIIKAERKFGLRTLNNCGYDVISDRFFVEETVINDRNDEQSVSIQFEDFQSYYEYLDGKVYDNACYYQCTRNKFGSFSLDYEHIYSLDSFVTETIDDNAWSIDEDAEKYAAAERNKKLCKKWFVKFNKCETFEEFYKTVESFARSKLYGVVDVSVFFFDFIFSKPGDENRFNIIMKYMSTGKYPEYLVSNALCHVFPADKVIAAYNYSSGGPSTRSKHKRNLKQYAQEVKDGQFKVSKQAHYNKNIHYYCETTTFKKTRKPFGWYEVYRCFETLDEFISYRKGDLTNTDLTWSPEVDYDFSACKIDDTTLLPLRSTGELNYTVVKRFVNNKFQVIQSWKNADGAEVRRDKRTFNYFFDFVAFLKGDLSGADLTMCDGMINLSNVNGLILKDAKLLSAVCDKFGIAYEHYQSRKAEVFDVPFQNEIQSASAYNEIRNPEQPQTDLIPSKGDSTNRRVYYISDLHLEHRLINAKSIVDVENYIKKIVESILEEAGGLILIIGDVAADFELFKMFVQALKEKNRYREIIFTLGNHELWGFAGKTVNEIVDIYEKLISDAGMMLLHNSIIYEDADRKFHNISAEQIMTMEAVDLRECCRAAKLIIFGGTAFSGQNFEFNANNGIYRNALSRDDEIRESRTFFALYQKVESVFPDRPLIIMTHTPKEDWSEDSDYHKNYIYVSGHTHRNAFYDDGEIRVYADNQVGYKNVEIHTKWFFIDYRYDYFQDYKDGVYEITPDQYREFYRGVNISMEFNRDVGCIYMLKKSGYYCFLCRTTAGNLMLMNGGNIKRAVRDNVDYYYDNMDSQIERIKRPLEIYSSYQQKIASHVKSFGGDGSIHGCIIDIDFYNHLYVNPIDSKVTPYWASDIINKVVYQSLPELLEANCPALFQNYQSLIGEKMDLPAIEAQSSIQHRQVYLGTDIYRASREIRKMQKLASGILAMWVESEKLRLTK